MVFEGEYIEIMLWFKSDKNYIQLKNNYSYLAVTYGVRKNKYNKEWEWWSSKVSASRICNDFNCTKSGGKWSSVAALCTHKNVVLGLYQSEISE